VVGTGVDPVTSAGGASGAVLGQAIRLQVLRHEAEWPGELATNQRPANRARPCSAAERKHLVRRKAKAGARR
jgi:hypothetical protein